MLFPAMNGMFSFATRKRSDRKRDYSRPTAAMVRT